MSVDDLAARVGELWDAEWASAEFRYEPAMFGHGPSWTVSLEWTSERGNPHGADWATYQWAFYADTLAEALADAVDWLEQLAPWRRCAPCGGEGDEHQAACDVCHGTGLHQPADPRA